VAVGRRVAALVGATVGMLVGVAVGVAVGVLVGVFAGVLVGVFAGVLVGATVDVLVGALVGVAVGVAVGAAVGVLVGAGAPTSTLILMQPVRAATRTMAAVAAKIILMIFLLGPLAARFSVRHPAGKLEKPALNEWRDQRDHKVGSRF